MGGMHGEIRGLNKGECAELFLELRDGTLKHWSIDPNTRSKRELKTMMEQDPDTGEWVLAYYAHT